MHTVKYYRDKLIRDLSIKIAKDQLEGVQEYVIAGNFNQDITYENVQKFIRENRLFEAHCEVYKLDKEE